MSRRLVVEADGGSRGNPGVAGYGALVRDEDGTVLLERAEPLGRASNNVAEYSGLVAGLEGAASIEPGADVLVRMDSKLVVEQMSGRWKIKHADMRRLADVARGVADGIEAAGGSVAYEWVPRARNKAADALSNRAMDGESVDERPAGADDGGHGSDPGADAPEAETDRGAADGPDSPERPGDPGASAPRPESTRRPRAAAAERGAPTRVVLVRHGVTELTRAGRLDGRGGIDPDLDAEGQRQARAAAAGVRDFVGGAAGLRVVSSGLSRGRQTGALVAAALGVSRETRPAWDEQDVGEWDGRSLSDLATRHGDDLSRMRSDPGFVPPGGESYAALRERVVADHEELVAGGGTVVVATHRSPIMAVLEHALGLEHEMTWRLALAPASLTSLRVWPDGGVSVEFVNDTAHLRR